MKTFLITEKFQKCFCYSIKARSSKLLKQHYLELLELEILLQNVKIPDDLVGEFICRNFMDLLKYTSGSLPNPSNWSKYPQDERFLVDLAAARWRKDWTCFYSLYEPVLDNILYWAFKQEVIDFKVERNQKVYGNFERARIGGDQKDQKDQKKSSFWSFLGFKQKESVEVFKCVVGQEEDQTDSEDDLVWHESPLPVVAPKSRDHNKEKEKKLQAKLANEERKAVEAMEMFNDIGRRVLGKSTFYIEQKGSSLIRPLSRIGQTFQDKIHDREREAVRRLEEMRERRRMDVVDATVSVKLARASFEKDQKVSATLVIPDVVKARSSVCSVFVGPSESAGAAPEPPEEIEKDQDQNQHEENYEYAVRLIMDDSDDDLSSSQCPEAEASVPPESAEPNMNENGSLRFADSSDGSESSGSEDEGDVDDDDLEDYLEPEGTLEYLPAGWVISDKDEEDASEENETPYSTQEDPKVEEEDLEDFMEPVGTLEYWQTGSLFSDKDEDKEDSENDKNSLLEITLCNGDKAEEADEEDQCADHVDSEAGEDKNPSSPDASDPSEDVQEDQDNTSEFEKLDLDFQHQLAIQKQKHHTELQLLKHKRWMLQEEMKIRMKGRSSRRDRIQEILAKNPVVLFSRTLEIEKSKIAMEILKEKSVPFYHVPVDVDVEIRLGIKEFTGREEFPQLLINGEVVEVEGLEEVLSNC